MVALKWYVLVAFGTPSGLVMEGGGILSSDVGAGGMEVITLPISSVSIVEKYSSIMCQSALRLYALHDLRSMTEATSAGSWDALMVLLFP